METKLTGAGETRAHQEASDPAGGIRERAIARGAATAGWVVATMNLQQPASR